MRSIYTALYRKLRPLAFADIVGQEHIVRTLLNQIVMGRVTHAYLFTGTRGTGKTSCAKVFARAVNCEAPQNGEACNVCGPCIDIARGKSLDVIEIDAASNNGVDSIRELREEVRYPPSGRYKVYIVDEVHMLSTGAFNALLKTLEEPPPHVIFILATTDPQKIPATIHSRLMRFDFHRPALAQMEEALAGYMRQENIAISPEAIEYVARISDGSWRDALSLLDRCASLYYDEEITLDKALEVTGSVDVSVFFDTITALLEGDAQKCLNIIEDLSVKGRDFSQFTEEMLYHLRNRLIEANRAGAGDSKELIGLIAAFAELSRQIRHNRSHARLMLEVACIDYVTGPVQTVREEAPASKAPAKKERAVKEEKPQPPKKAVPQDIRAVLSDWRNFVEDFKKDLPFIENTRAGFLEDEYLYIVCPDLFMESHLRKHTDYIREKLQSRYGLDFNLNIMAKNFYDDRHNRKYRRVDDFKYDEGKGQKVIDKLKGMIDYEIEEG